MPNAIVGGALVGGFLVMLVLESINWQGVQFLGFGDIFEVVRFTF
jgi:hypothetical protein